MCGDNEKLMFAKKQLTYGNVFSVKCFRNLHILETNEWTNNCKHPCNLDGYSFHLKKLFTH